MDKQINDAPLVMVRCMTYNHEPYIRQCLEGFVMQQTNFKFVACVIDDASTDKTADIVREFEEKYPDIIKATYLKENHYSQNKSKLPYYQHWHDIVKYLALCEGDDYWTDPLKLQKQVDFLEANEDYSICFCHAKVYVHEEKRFEDDFTRQVPETTTILDLAVGNYIQTPSVMFRNNLKVYKEYQNVIDVMGNIFAGDYLLHLLYAKYGKIKKLDDIMVVYRKNQTSVLTPLPIEKKRFIWQLELFRITPFFDDNVKCVLSKQYDCINEKIIESYYGIQNSYSYKLGYFLLSPFRFIRNIFKKI